MADDIKDALEYAAWYSKQIAIDNARAVERQERDERIARWEREARAWSARNKARGDH